MQHQLKVKEEKNMLVPALSFFESELIRKGNKNPQLLSEMYIVRKLRGKSLDKYIRMDGKINFSRWRLS